jgi:hypothetical protein
MAMRQQPSHERESRKGDDAGADCDGNESERYRTAERVIEVD